jgi:hypothetical protein
MRVLRLVGPGDDSTSVVLESDNGEQFSLLVDERLRAASRADRAHLGQIDAALAGPLRPRDIQIRIRAGESAEELAEVSGMPVDRVLRFAHPVLAERARVADEARRARARRAGDGHLVPFGELVDTRLAAHGIEPESVRWDAFRRPDGGWTVIADVPNEQAPVRAKFSFSLGNRTVSALDDVAADLLSGRPIKAWSEPGSPAATAFSRLIAVPDSAPDASQPAQRARAYTHPLPLALDDDFLEQDVFDQEGFSDSPAGYGSAEHAGLDHPGLDDSADLDPVPVADTYELAQARELEPAALWTDIPELNESALNETTGTGERSGELGRPTANHAAAARRGGRHGDKPRMPSWDDILLGVRRKSD